MRLQQAQQSTIAITGASGFVGAALLDSLLGTGRQRIIALTRYRFKVDRAAVEHVPYDLLAPVDLESSLRDVDCLVHLAARVHVMNESSANPLDTFLLSNLTATVNLAKQAASAGVRRFVFISSIKVNGESTVIGAPFMADELPKPEDPYGISKHEAEQALQTLAAETGMEVVIIRPVLVYGPGVKANFHNMMSWLAKGMPLPFGAIHNQRSLVALDNLLDLIVTCIDHPAAANQTFLVSDDEDISTSQLLRRMAQALGKPARLLPLPAWMLTTAAALLGKRSVAQRLCGSLQVDISKTKSLLGWTPPVSVNNALEKTAKYFLEHNQ